MSKISFLLTNARNGIKNVTGFMMDGAVACAASYGMYGLVDNTIGLAEEIMNSGVEERQSRIRHKTYYIDKETGKKLHGYKPKKIVTAECEDGYKAGLSAVSLAVGGLTGRTFHKMRKTTDMMMDEIADVDAKYFGEDMDISPEEAMAD